MRDVARRDAVRLLETETVAEAMARLRGEALGERIVYFYVTDEAGRLTGVVPTRRLILSAPSTLVRDAMIRPVVAIAESEPFRNALSAITERRLLALPVVDADGRLTGVLDLTAFTERLLDLERRESAEELFQLAGVHIEREKTGGELRSAARRVPWLLVNVASGIGAAGISEAFGGVLRAVVALAFFVPLVLTLAESVAMQTVTMSLTQLQMRAGGMGGFAREFRAGGLLGLATGLVAAAATLVWLGNPALAGAVAGGIVLAAAAGAALGFVVPRLVRRWNLNPNIASGPVALALADLAALVCYFGLSSLVLL